MISRRWNSLKPAADLSLEAAINSQKLSICFKNLFDEAECWPLQRLMRMVQNKKEGDQLGGRDTRFNFNASTFFL